MPMDDGKLSVVAMWVLIIWATSFSASGADLVRVAVRMAVSFGRAEYRAPVGVSNSFSTCFRISSKSLAHEPENRVSVAVELGLADAVDAQQSLGGTGFVLGDQLQRGIGEDDVRGNALLGCLAGAPGAQLLEQLLVVGRRAVAATAALLLRPGGQRLAALAAADDLAALGAGRLGARARGQQRVEEPRGLTGGATAGVAGPRPRHGERVPGAGDPDVQQPALLLDLGGRLGVGERQRA